MGRGSNQKDPHVELNKKSQFINIYFLAANAINMLHVNNNCTDIFWKSFFRDLFSGCRCYKGSGINVRKKCCLIYALAIIFLAQILLESLIISCEMRKVQLNL